MNYLVLLRHGESLWNLENRFTGFTDIDLSDKGKEEAKATGKLISNIKFDKIFTSTLMRTIHTAEIALENSGEINAHLAAKDNSQTKFIMTCSDDLKERDYGDLAGLNKDETRKKFGDEQVQIWRRSYDTPPPNGESLKDVVARVKPYYLDNIKPEIDNGKNILVVAHGNSLRAMLIVLGVRTPEDINKMEIPTGVPIIFEFENGEMLSWRILNDNKAEKQTA